MMPYTCHSWQQRTAQAQQVQVTPTPTRVVPPRRQIVLGGMLALSLVGLTGRLAYWQIAQHGKLSVLANGQQLKTISIPSGRGMILDRNGVILAVTVTGNAVVLHPNSLQVLEKSTPGTRERVARQLATLSGLAKGEVLRQLSVSTGYALLVDGQGAAIRLSPDAANQLNVALAQGVLPTITTEPYTWRDAPGGALASQILGFVRTDTGEGQYGIEQSANDLLAGTPGKMHAAFDNDGHPLASSDDLISPAVPGSDVTLTLDANIQSMAESGLADAIKTMGASGGSVIVADPQTGAILAMASAGGFDPNHYGASPTAAFLNPAVSNVYNPGSTMKAITMAAGLDTGVITPQTSFIDPGYFVAGGQTIYNWNELPWGNETMTQVLEHSANAGAAWVAVTKLGQNRFDRYINAFGFGTPTGVDLAGEVKGLMPPEETDPDLAQLDLAENSFGESISVTPLQLVMAYGALANGGNLMKPMIIGSVDRDGQQQPTKPTVVRRVISQETAATITAMLAESSQHSDALTSLIQGYSVAAKTGTSTPDPAHPEITFASVIGYAPATHPKFVLLVKLDHPQTTVLGGEAAGPLWRALTRQILAYDQIPPQGGTQP